ncbi:MAG: hypothetical protein ACOCZ5_00905 [bacterium]
MAHNRITPFIKRLRTNGGTIYTFSSSQEDIGLNINERNNIVKISHFALLDLPEINEPNDISTNKMNLFAIPGAFDHEKESGTIKDGRSLIAESFQNYALNLESLLLNREDYNPNLRRTVSERVFWKWLKETGAIRWTHDADDNWVEESFIDTSTYKPIVKYIGPVSAGNIKTDNFGTYNETYLLIPTSHGQTNAYFYQYDDDNYKHGLVLGDLSENILGREDYTKPHPDILDYVAYYDFVDSSSYVGSYNTYFKTYDADPYEPGWWYSQYEDLTLNFSDNAYIIDSSEYLVMGGETGSINYNCKLKYDDGGGDVIEFLRSNIDALSLQLDLDELKDIYDDDTLTYDKIATEYSINDDFEFNAALIYYSVYNSTGETRLSTNLLGIYFLDAPVGNSQDIGEDGIKIPSLEKIQSTATGFGTSYQMRLNIKSGNIIDDTQAVFVDKSTSDQVYPDDFTEVFNNLNESVKILMQNQETINYISDQYADMTEKMDLISNNVENIQTDVEESQTQIVSELINAKNIDDGDSIGVYYGKTITNDIATFNFKRIKGAAGINVSEEEQGIITIDASGSFEGIYDPELSDDIDMPEDVGSLSAGTTVGDLRGTPYTQLWNKLLFPVIEPEYVDPYNTFRIDPSTTLYEVNSEPEVEFISEFDKGAITIDGSIVDYRSGDPSVYEYIGDDLDSSTSNSLTHSQTITVGVAQGTQTWESRVFYKDGPQPKDDRGNDYGSPLPAGYTSYKTITIEGVYPIYATTVDISTLSKQELVSMENSTEVEISLVKEQNGYKQTFDIPDDWPNSLQTVETFNTLTDKWEDTGLNQWDVSTATHKDAQSNTVDYKRYIYNGPDRGAIDIRLKF